VVHLFRVDGDDNPEVQAVHVPRMQIRSAAFSPDGGQILMCGERSTSWGSFDLHAPPHAQVPRAAAFVPPPWCRRLRAAALVPPLGAAPWWCRSVPPRPPGAWGVGPGYPAA
jgi:hypothetical protein